MAANGNAEGALKVGIVGAGVAGLAAGIALRRIGHDVEVRPSQSLVLTILQFFGLRFNGLSV